MLLPVSALQHGKGRFVAETREGEEPLVYEDMEKLKEDYKADKVNTLLLKHMQLMTSAAYASGAKRWRQGRTECSTRTNSEGV